MAFACSRSLKVRVSRGSRIDGIRERLDRETSELVVAVVDREDPAASVEPDGEAATTSGPSDDDGSAAAPRL